MEEGSRENIQGVKIGYTQSDEISLFLSDYDKIDTESWYHYNIQKLASVSASMTTLHFNRTFRQKVKEYENSSSIDLEYLKILKSKIDGAIFDSRAFSLPKSEVNNYFIWRQQDATRNSIQMAGQHYFSHKQLQKKKCNDIQDMLINEKQINWNDYPISFKRGVCINKETVKIKEGVYRGKWYIDNETPIFSQDKGYINSKVVDDIKEVLTNLSWRFSFLKEDIQYRSKSKEDLADSITQIQEELNKIWRK